MLYDNIICAKFISRKNRFTAKVALNPFSEGNEVEAHVPSTGRMGELLYKGADVFLVPAKSKERKTLYTLVASIKEGKVRLIDSRINTVFKHLFPFINDFKGFKIDKFEHQIGKSRFDVLLYGGEKKGIVEIKSVTLLEDGVASFPDAPSLRAVKHIRELLSLKDEGYDVFLVFLISGEAKYFIPNFFTDALFFAAFSEGYKRGLNIYAYSYELDNNLSLKLKPEKVLIPYKRLLETDCDKGSYLVIYKNNKKTKIDVGKLGKIVFEKGYYIYSGSAKISISARTKRHKTNQQNKRWHIDYIHPPFELVKIIRFPSLDVECMLSNFLSKYFSCVKGFGSSDCNCASHFFYSESNPQKEDFFTKDLYKIMLNRDNLGL
jgi:sugar fermentation stimulation protein A